MASKNPQSLKEKAFQDEKLKATINSSIASLERITKPFAQGIKRYHNGLNAAGNALLKSNCNVEELKKLSNGEAQILPLKPCKCGCGEIVEPGRKYFNASCSNRARQRKHQDKKALNESIKSKFPPK